MGGVEGLNKNLPSQVEASRSRIDVPEGLRPGLCVSCLKPWVRSASAA